MRRGPVSNSRPGMGLVGWPVKHSLSPAMHNVALEALGLAGRSVLLATRPDEVEAVVSDLRTGSYAVSM